MNEYTLEYWPIPFRGQFIRAVLAHVGATWEEESSETLASRKTLPPSEQPIPFMGLPVLTDHGAKVSLSQTSSILEYLGRKYRLLPEDSTRSALTTKTVADANDLLYEMTRHNGAQMWTQESWESFQPRLRRWMQVFEVTGVRHGLRETSGTFLGTPQLGIADLVTATLWGTMTRLLPSLRPLLDDNAPAVAGLSDRVGRRPEQAELRVKSDAAFGKQWCGGQIEASLRSVLS